MDLTDVLSQEVHVSSSSAVIDNSDYTDAVIDDIPDEAIAEKVVQEEIPNTDQPKAMPPKHMAEMMVGVVNGLQSSLIPFFRKQSLFTAKEIEILDNLDTTGGTIYPPDSPDGRVLAKWRKHMEISALLPFSDAEKERLTAATERYCATMQITVSPFVGLLAAFGEVAATRAVYLMSE